MKGPRRARHFEPVVEEEDEAAWQAAVVPDNL